MKIPTEIKFRTVMPTVEQEAAMDKAAAYESECEKEWKAARDAKPFDKALEVEAWKKYQAAMDAASRL